VRLFFLYDRCRSPPLLDSYLENLIDRDTYQRKARDLGEERLGFEQRRIRLEQATPETLTARPSATFRVSRRKEPPSRFLSGLEDSPRV
jgi:hypothetical protein